MSKFITELHKLINSFADHELPSNFEHLVNIRLLNNEIRNQSCKNQPDKKVFDKVFTPLTENEIKINEIYEHMEFESRMSCYEEDKEE